MQKNVRVVFLVLLLCTGCFLFAWNLHSAFLNRPEMPLAISPANVEFRTAFSEGSEFSAEFTLENKTDSDCVIKKIISSCGCTGVFTQNQESINVPFTLSPSNRFSFLVIVDTTAMEGERGVSVMALYEHKGQSLYSVGNILFEVTPKVPATIQ